MGSYKTLVHAALLLDNFYRSKVILVHKNVNQITAVGMARKCAGMGKTGTEKSRKSYFVPFRAMKGADSQ